MNKQCAEEATFYSGCFKPSSSTSIEKRLISTSDKANRYPLNKRYNNNTLTNKTSSCIVSESTMPKSEDNANALFNIQ